MSDFYLYDKIKEVEARIDQVESVLGQLIEELKQNKMLKTEKKE